VLFRSDTVTSGTSYQNTSLTPNTTYIYTISAYDQAGNSSGQSAAVNVTTPPLPDTTPPSVPTNLLASGITTTSVTLSWTASTDNVGVAGYRVYRNGTQVATVTSGASYQDTVLTPNTTYAYTVRAYDQAGNTSAISASLNATTLPPPDITPPTVPTNLAASGITTNSVTLSWTASTDNVGVVGYRVYRNGTSVATVTSGTSYQDINLPPATTYSYTVSAYDQAGNNSAPSAPVNATTLTAADTTPPSVPTNLAASGMTLFTVTLSWTASTDNVGVAGYKVFRNGPQVATVASVTTYQDTGLTPNTTYAYTVSAYDQAGNNSASSAALNATTLSDTTPPSVPTNLLASGITTTSVTLSWTASTDNVGVAGYRIYRNGTSVATTTGTSYQDTGLTSNTTYTYTVQAYDQAGNNSTQSAQVSPTTLSPPDTSAPTVPTNLAASGITSTSVTLSWTASTDNVGVTGYKIFRNGTQVATATGTSYQNTSLTPNTMYAYTVSAYDQAGNNSAQSASVNATTLPLPDTTPPTVPTNLAASGITSTSVTLSWTASTDNVGVTGYKVFRNGAQVGTATATSYPDSSLTPNTTYAYTVSAYDQAGNNSAQLAPLNVTTLPPPDTTPPTVPTNVVVSGITSTSMLISWTASTDNVGVAGYKFYRNGTQVATVTSGTSYQNTNLTPSTAYTYTVQAYDQAGNNSALSSPVIATTLPPPDTTPPTVPTSLVASGITSTTSTISWTASTDNVGVVGYRVYRNGTQVGTVTGTSYSDTNHAASTTYAYTVSAYDQAGNSSAQSASLNVTTTATPPPTVYSVTLAWDAPTTNVDGSPLTNLAGYWLYYGTSSGVFTTNVNIGNVATYTVSNLSYGTYYFAVKAYNSNNNFSDYSAPTYGLCVNVSATPTVCPQ
jgi:chitodextrinase